MTRKNDRWIGAGATVATAAWMLLALGFGAAIGDILDPRGLVHAGASAALLITTLLSASDARSRG